MQTDLPRSFAATLDGARADEILRTCVHCGFCNATCPTYLQLGDELDGPRGRIYLMKEMLESQQADAVTQQHLDRCLTCRSCETTCPSGVRYGELLEIGREFLEARQPRGRIDGWMRRWLLSQVPYPRRFRRWARLGGWFRWLLPRRLAAQVPPAPAARRFSPPTVADATRRVLVLQGCVQQVATPEVNERLVALLASRGVQVTGVPDEGCCGSLGLHLGETALARATMVRNVDALTRAIGGGTAGGADGATAPPGMADVEAILSTASGCGVTVREYGRLFADDPAHYHAAQRLADMTLDASEFLHQLDTPWRRRGTYRKVAWHAPCTLQHGQQVRGHVEALLGAAGYELVPVTDAHLCCGSAGTYAILQPSLAEKLKTDKVAALEREGPDVIATANIGCQLHLASAAGVPVVHWLELLE